MVAPLPAHTPYDGSASPFTIGLRQLDPATWLEVDDDFDAYIAEKRRLYAAIPDKVLVEEPGTREAQQEVLDLIVSQLSADDLHRSVRAGSEASDETRDLPLERASLLVQEDLILMRRSDDGWRLAAGSLCFPSSWSLAEKFGRPLHIIHDPVPGFGTGTRNADLIARMFDKLQVSRPVERLNWSVQANADLYHPLSDRERDLRAADQRSKFPGGDAACAFIRVERQTLRKLPISGDVLFTIRIYLDPLARLASHPRRAELAASFANQIAALDTAQLDYKGMSADRDRLVEYLRTMV